MTEFSRTTYNLNDRIVFNDTATDSTKYILVNAPSITDTLVLNTEDEKSGDAGIIDYGSKLSKGDWPIPITLYANSIGQMAALIQDLKEALNPDLMEADPSYGETTFFYGYHPMKWTEVIGETSTALMAYVKSQEIPQVAGDSMSGRIRRTVLRFKLQDPRKYRQSETTLEGAGTATNGGTYTTPVTITITATGTTDTGLQLTNSTTGETIYITTALTNGQVLVLDSANHSCKIDGVETRSAVGAGTTWWLLEPGNNTLAITNGTNATINFAWHDAWPL